MKMYGGTGYKDSHFIDRGTSWGLVEMETANFHFQKQAIAGGCDRAHDQVSDNFYALTRACQR